MEKKYAYSEIFSSFQGEGYHTGEPTMWLRFFTCNLNCDGFGQKDPTDPTTYKLPYKDVDLSNIKDINKLPVFEYGCDSSYSWSSRYKHLQYKKTISEICEEILSKLPNKTFNDNFHMCFTGGEPLLKHGQEASVEIMKYFYSIGEKIPSVTFETNGTQKLTEEFKDFWGDTKTLCTELFMSISPKLYTVSGEKREKAIKPEIVAEYSDLTDAGQLKFVVSGTEESWNEVEELICLFRQAGVKYPVWIMPLGATVEGQEGKISGHISAAQIADESLKRGYRVAVRAHTYVYGNVIGK